MATTKCTNGECTRTIGGWASYGDGDRDYAKAVRMCVPCATEAGWENAHNDGHDRHSATGEIDATEVEHCWICHPELNNAQLLAERKWTGTSRTGMTIHVTPKASGLDKAAQTGEQFPKAFAVAISKPTKRNGQVTTLKAATSVGNGFVLRWDASGRFFFGQFLQDGKPRKVRNVSEALRLAK